MDFNKKYIKQNNNSDSSSNNTSVVGGGLSMSTVWTNLANESEEQIDGSHLYTALQNYVLNSDSRLDDAREPYFLNNKWYPVGNNASIGDNNQAGAVCIKGLTGNPTVKLYDRNNNFYGEMLNSVNFSNYAIPQSERYLFSVGPSATYMYNRDGYNVVKILSISCREGGWGGMRRTWRIYSDDYADVRYVGVLSLSAKLFGGGVIPHLEWNELSYNPDSSLNFYIGHENSDYIDIYMVFFKWDSTIKFQEIENIVNTSVFDVPRELSFNLRYSDIPSNNTHEAEKPWNYFNYVNVDTLESKTFSAVGVAEFKSDGNESSLNLYDTDNNKKIQLKNEYGNYKMYRFNGSSWNNILTITDSGNLTATGDVTAYSDARLKDNIEDLRTCPFVRPVEYDRKIDKKHSIGFVAQDIEELYPELVNTDEKGYKSVNYAQYTAVLQQQNIEQQKEIDDLKFEKIRLEREISELKNQMLFVFRKIGL